LKRNSQEISFKLEEESAAPLHDLPQLFAETAVFGSASGFGCRLVVGFAQDSSVLGIVKKNGLSLVKEPVQEAFNAEPQTNRLSE
jgi:hypothetical protein